MLRKRRAACTGSSGRLTELPGFFRDVILSTYYASPEPYSPPFRCSAAGLVTIYREE